MLVTDGKPRLQRALIFLLVLGVSIPVFPLAAFALAPVLTRVIKNFMFFWPQVVLVPYGFMNMETGGSEAFFMDSAIYGAIIWWVLVAAVFGRVLENSEKKKVAWLVIPVALGVVVALQALLHSFGYTVYLDGP